jgi:thymidylate kinase
MGRAAAPAIKVAWGTRGYPSQFASGDMGKVPASRGCIVAVEGPSGVGKTTLVTEVARRWPGRALPEAFVRLRPPPPLDFRTRSGLLKIEGRLAEEEERRFLDAARRRDEGEAVLLDTGTLGPLTYSWGLRCVAGPSWDVVAEVRDRFWTALARGRWGIPDLTIYLDVPPALAATRATGAPETHPVELVERHRNVAIYERELWCHRFPRRLPQRFERLDARPPATVVARSLLSRLERYTTLSRATVNDATRLLASFRAGPTTVKGTARTGNR